MLEMPPKQELFSDYKEEIDEIRNIYSDLVDKAMESEEPYNPAVKFKNLLREKFAEAGVETPIEKYGAYHYAIGSTPRADTIAESVPEFDTKDQLIQRTLKEFAETI